MKSVRSVKLSKLAKVVAFVVMLVGSRLWEPGRGWVGELADWAALARVGPPSIPARLPLMGDGCLCLPYWIWMNAQSVVVKEKKVEWSFEKVHGGVDTSFNTKRPLG